MFLERAQNISDVFKLLKNIRLDIILFHAVSDRLLHDQAYLYSKMIPLLHLLRQQREINPRLRLRL